MASMTGMAITGAMVLVVAVAGIPAMLGGVAGRAFGCLGMPVRVIRNAGFRGLLVVVSHTHSYFPIPTSGISSRKSGLASYLMATTVAREAGSGASVGRYATAYRSGSASKSGPHEAQHSQYRWPW